MLGYRTAMVIAWIGLLIAMIGIFALAVVRTTAHAWWVPWLGGVLVVLGFVLVFIALNRLKEPERSSADKALRG